MGTPSQLGFNSDHNFFGFRPEDRVVMHDNLFNLIWHGEGRWSWDDVYHMPIIIRTLWVKRVNEIIQTKAEAAENAMKAAKQRTARKKKAR